MSFVERLAQLYPDQQPLSLPGSPGNLFRPPSPRVLVFRGDAPPHWHFVSSGIRDTYEDPEQGAELSFRVPRDPADEAAPPGWASDFFATVARHFLNSSASFEIGHHLEIRGSMAGLPFALGVADPELDPQREGEGPRVVQLLGITEDDLDALMSWNAAGFTSLLRDRDPLLLTAQNRASLRDDPARRAAIARGIAEDGSAMESIYTACVEWEHTLAPRALTLFLDEAAVPHLSRLLCGRTLRGREFFLASHEDATKHVTFVSGDAPSFAFSEGAPRIVLSPSLAEAMAAALQGRERHLSWPELPGFVLQVVDELGDHGEDADEGS